ncbi:unnamed protein product [Fraxinus pennsylvanica]|uniref:Uncharacterized protein n=1 Tax=Fraxinus pennsylvanica TaxID=56036 RepID=A0AAD1YPH6_9LAMI|nr:unnamed protein product [Fraxinus pennsylvanica]
MDTKAALERRSWRGVTIRGAEEREGPRRRVAGEVVNLPTTTAAHRFWELRGFNLGIQGFNFGRDVVRTGEKIARKAGNKIGYSDSGSPQQHIAKNTVFD